MNTIATQKKIEDTMVVVGMSGGVDSSVSAYLLKEQGYRVVGLFMKNWEELDENGVCQSSKEYADVVKVCEQLDIPYYSVDFVQEYRERVFQSFLDDYAKGLTPNPDILCNREIKFDVFFKYARDLGADFLATGHYCQNKIIHGQHRLVKGLDTGKDQSYFLHAISEKVLPHVLFPIGHLQKAEVRDLAAQAGLATKEKKDSTGICFIGERNFRPFLSQYLAPKKGSFVDLDRGRVGEHEGAQFYTIGQRKGLGFGGQGEPWFVVDKKMENNEVIVVRGERHPRLFADELWAGDLNWINIDGESRAKTSPKLFAKTRYRQPDQGIKSATFFK
jgi:tRNA-uridine 2-sulfurtransferase